MRIFGDHTVTGTDSDLMHLLGTVDPAEIPELYLSCGTEDECIDDNRAFIELAARRGIPFMGIAAA